MEELILVNERDEAIGVGEKMQVHHAGTLHRAFSIFIFDAHGHLLLQKRAQTKYHSGGMWSNTCCSHPKPGESIETAAHRRLQEEMGFDCELRKIFAFIYKAEVDHHLIEHEYDHVFVGAFNGTPAPNVLEVGDWKWMEMEALARDIEAQPRHYTYWLQVALQEFKSRHLYGI